MCVNNTIYIYIPVDTFYTICYCRIIIYFRSNNLSHLLFFSGNEKHIKYMHPTLRIALENLLKHKCVNMNKL